MYCVDIGVWTLEEKGQSPDVDVTFETAKPTLSHLALIALEQAGMLFRAHLVLLFFVEIIIIIIKRQFIRRSNMARVTTRAPHNVRCSYSGRQLVTEVGSRKQMCLEHHFER